jgi:23S rRNA (guanosine2251-2'-O)-methyltransferase
MASAGNRRLVVGVHPVLELLAARGRDVVQIFASHDDVLAQARSLGVPAERRQPAELDVLAPGLRHQGAVALVGEYPYVDPDELCAPSRGTPLVLALDSVTDPQNLGALVRSAHVLGASGVVIPQDRAARVTPAVVRASAGATEHTAIASVVNLVRTLEAFKQRGLWIVGAVAGGEGVRLPWQIDFREPTVIVIGAEGPGLRRLTRKVCDLHVMVPMAGRVGSLNAAAAGAILLYEAARQRGA